MSKILDMNKKAWDNLAESYADRSISPISEVFKAFIELLPGNGKILDLGSCTGVPYAKSLVGKGFDVLGVDLTDEMVKVASCNSPEARFEQMSMTEIPFVSEFDGILSNISMLLLTPDMFKEVAIRIHSALQDGGYFYLALSEPGNDSFDPDSEVFVNKMGQDMYSHARKFLFQM